MTDRNQMHILTIKKLSKRFGKAEMLKNIKLSLGLGEIFAIIGPNGAGKTTLFNLISGIIPKDEGVVTYYQVAESEENQVDITNKKAYEVARLGIGRTFQGNRVFNNMTVIENVMLAKQLCGIENPFSIMKRTHKNILSQLKKRDTFKLDKDGTKNLEQFLRHEAEYWLHFVGLKDEMENKGEELSYGQQKLLSIARLLMADSRLLLFDEPTAGVNPKYSSRIAEIFKKIVEDKQKTILFIEHDMKFIQKIGCKCLYLEDGKCPWPFFELEVIMKNEDIRRKFMGM